MNTWIRSAILLTAAVVTTATYAQDKPAKPKMADSNEEIVIRKNGNTKEKTTIVIEGEKVTVNGKPLDEYKGDNVTIKKMKTRGEFPGGRAFLMERNGPGEGMNGMMPPMPPMPPANKALLGVTTEKVDEGVRVTGVSEESGAAKAGLKKEDVITKVGNKKIEAPRDLVEAINSYKPADKVDITYKRDGKEIKTTATLGENKMRSYSFNFNDKDFKYEMPDKPFAPNLDGSMFSWNRKPKIGMQIQDLEEGNGVKVKDVDEDSPAEKSGFKEGDVITGINGKMIAGVDDLKKEISNLKEGDSFKVDFKRDGKQQTADIKIPKKMKTADL